MCLSLLGPTFGSARPHLDGRMPHALVAELFESASKCKTAADVEKLRSRVPHVAARFSAIIREFRASVPAAERKRGHRRPRRRMDRDALRIVDVFRRWAEGSTKVSYAQFCKGLGLDVKVLDREACDAVWRSIDIRARNLQ